MYYYFYRNRKIMELPEEVDLAVNPAFAILTDEQAAFYIAHPDASVEEVRQCVMFPRHCPVPPSLEEQKALAKDNLKVAYQERLRSYDELGMVLAVTSRICIQNGWHSEAEVPFGTEEARAAICGYAHLGKAVRDAYTAGIAAVETAGDEEALAVAVTASLESIAAAGTEVSL